MRALVVGGGIAGLAAAHAFARAGLDVTLVDAAPRLGGKIATERGDGFIVERGPDSFLTARPTARRGYLRAVHRLLVDYGRQLVAFGVEELPAWATPLRSGACSEVPRWQI